MLSTELPITDWWDPEYDVYDVPLCPQGDYDDPDETEAWWAAYDHLETVRHIMTGRRWYSPDNFYAHQVEPPRRPPSWYPGQPEQRPPRIRPCTCFYGLRTVPDAPRPWEDVRTPGIRRRRFYTRCFVIVWDCPHHGDDLLDVEAELDDLYGDAGGVWGFTMADCVLDEDERTGH